MANVVELAQTLGLGEKGGPVGAIEIVDAVRRGLAVSALDTVAHALAEDASFKYRIVPKASLGRRKATSLLTPQESDRVARLARVWVFAKEVWGSEAEARDFLHRPHPMLEDRKPIDLIIDSEIGAELVSDVLGRLLVGSAA